jgi:ribosomal protein S27AE
MIEIRLPMCCLIVTTRAGFFSATTNSVTTICFEGSMKEKFERLHLVCVQCSGKHIMSTHYSRARLGRCIILMWLNCLSNKITNVAPSLTSFQSVSNLICGMLCLCRERPRVISLLLCWFLITQEMVAQIYWQRTASDY